MPFTLDSQVYHPRNLIILIDPQGLCESAPGIGNLASAILQPSTARTQDRVPYPALYREERQPHACKRRAQGRAACAARGVCEIRGRAL